MRTSRSVVATLALGALLAGCSPDKEPSAPPTSAASVPPSATPSASPTKPKPKPTTKPTVPPSPTATPSASPTPKPTPKPTTPPGTVMTTNGAFLQASEDENLTNPDPENGCEVHDPDLDNVQCGVVHMAGGIATWVNGYEQHKPPGAQEPRQTIRIYRRLPNGTDSLAYVGFGEPEQWAEATARPGSLTGQTNDSLVVVVTFRGSGTNAGFDILTWRAGTSGPKLRAHWPAASHAQIYVRSKGYVSMYVADYSDGAPNCCPNSWQHYNAYWDGSVFRLRKFANVPSPPSS